MEDDICLPGLVTLRLVSLVYKARRPDGIACYSCVCRGLMDAWWYFEEGRSLEPIVGFVLHVKGRGGVVYACLSTHFEASCDAVNGD